MLALGCTAPRTQGTSKSFFPPKLNAGPTFSVLKIATVRDKVKAVIDAEGLGHVLVASSEQKAIHHILIDHKGVIADEVISTSVDPGIIDAAFDSAGHLHVLIGQQHLVKDRGIWQTSMPTPWGNAGVDAELATFAPGARELTWAVRVKGKAIGAPGRWDLFGFGGYGAGIIFPWHSDSTKLLLTRSTPEKQPSWIAIDPTDNSDISNARLAADRQGNLHILYERARYALGYAATAHYARVDADQLAGMTNDSQGLSQLRLRLSAVTGQPFHLISHSGHYYGSQTAIASDPDSSLALIMMGHAPSKLIKDGQASEAIPLPVSTFWDPQATPAGNERFHAIVLGEARDPWWGKGFPVLYILFSNRQWSAPVELGLADSSSFWGGIWEAVALAGDGSNRALVIWPKADGLMGRWLELTDTGK